MAKAGQVALALTNTSRIKEFSILCASMQRKLSKMNFFVVTDDSDSLSAVAETSQMLVLSAFSRRNSLPVKIVVMIFVGVPVPQSRADCRAYPFLIYAA